VCHSYWQHEFDLFVVVGEDGIGGMGVEELLADIVGYFC